jgi:hypothetical protein
VYWLGDGFHRYHAAMSLGLETLPCAMRFGTRRDAVLFSAGANQEHGLRRTGADKRKAVLTLLQDEEWSQWSNAEIARRCGVGHQLANDLRLSLAESASEKKPSRTYTTKHGTKATMKVEKIGRGGREAARVADLDARRAAAIEGASNAVLKRLPKKDDAEMVSRAVQTLRGIVSAFETVDPAPLSSDPRAEEWRGVVADTIAVLRSFNRRLERKAV